MANVCRRIAEDARVRSRQGLRDSRDNDVAPIAERQPECVSIARRLKDKMDGRWLRLSPKLALSQTTVFVPNEWWALSRRTQDGRLKFDNNVSGRRPCDQLIGRTIWAKVAPADDREAPYTEAAFQLDQQEQDEDNCFRRLLGGIGAKRGK
jgi:hypothetical protein